MTYQFEIIPKSWSKRRKPTAEAKPVSVAIPDFELIHQHFCNMQVTFEDGSQQTFLSRVLQNKITGAWTVDGMHVAVSVVIPD